MITPPKQEILRYAALTTQTLSNTTQTVTNTQHALKENVTVGSLLSVSSLCSDDALEY